MKKQFFVPACMLAAVAIGFIILALGHPELSFPWSTQITHVFYGLYVDAVVFLFILAFWKKSDKTFILAIALELVAAYFLVQSVLTVFPEGKANWYLPLALGLNCAALLLNQVYRRKQKRKDGWKE